MSETTQIILGFSIGWGIGLISLIVYIKVKGW